MEGLQRNPDYLDRRNRIREKIREKHLDALLISQPANRFYLSGFELHDPQPNESAGYLLLGANGDDWLCTDPRYAVAAERLWNKDRIFIYGNDHVTDLRSLMLDLGHNFGLEYKGISVDFFMKLAGRGNNKFTGVLVSADGMVESLRAIKDDSEIAALKSSFQLNHKLLNWLEEHLAEKEGLSEKDLSWEIERFFRENGAQELAFSNIVAAGTNGALPHAVPGETLIKNDGSLLVDIGCRVQNYCSDQTRTFWLGNNPDKEFLKTLQLVREAQTAAIEMIRPGVPCNEVYEAAKRVFAKAGVEKSFTHGLGHGVGLETHEAPSLNSRSKYNLERNMVVTVEPGLYFPEWGGVRWEYTVLVEENGAVIL